MPVCRPSAWPTRGGSVWRASASSSMTTSMVGRSASLARRRSTSSISTSRSTGCGSRYRSPVAKGDLRIYLGAAPGVGKTFAMLNEGWRGATRGKDVVVGFVETHGRANTAAQVRDLEVVPRKKIEYRGTQFE